MKTTLAVMTADVGSLGEARVEAAYRTLGVSPDASRAEVQAAYLKLVECFNPAKLAQRGDALPVLAVLKLAQVTAAFDAVRAWRDDAA